MSKEKSPKKNGKKEALMTAKEKRAAKKIKKAGFSSGLQLIDGRS